MGKFLERAASCSEGRKGCVKWVERYFKDCVCDLRGEISFGLGLVSLFCWGIAEIPQIVTNFQTQSGHGVSLALLLTWFIGDIFNLVGCHLEPVTLPTQFYTALLYTATTVVLLLQTIYYDYCRRWWKNRGFKASSEAKEERRPLNPDPEEDSTRPLPTTTWETPKPSQRQDTYYTSARSLARSGTPPYACSYLVTARSGPPVMGAGIIHCSSSDEESVPPTRPPIKRSKPRPIVSRSVSYGTFLAGSVGLPSQCKALMQVYGMKLLQETEANPYGLLLGWIMAAIYMGGRLPQIYLNIKRGNVEGLNPLMFIFALVANATYVGSILVRSVEWERIKANTPWLLDAIVCVLLDLFIILQYGYYKLKHRRRDNHEEDDCGEYMEAQKPQLV